MRDDSNILLIFVFVFGIVLGMLIRGNNKYEDLTAEEWFNDYDAVVGCVEDASTLFEAQNCL